MDIAIVRRIILGFWFFRWWRRRFRQAHHGPVILTPLDHGCSFSSEAVPEGVVATSVNTLRIISVDSSGLSDGDSDGSEAFNTNKLP